MKYKRIIIPIVSVILSLILGGIVITASGFSSITAYKELINGAFGNTRSLVNTLEKSIPLIFTGLAVMVSLKGGMFNIGAEGQLYMGAMAYALIGIYLKGIPVVLHITIALLASFIVGAAWALIAAILKMKRGAHEVVTTIMLNYIAIFFTNYLVSVPFKAQGMIPQTAALEKTAIIPKIVSGSNLSWGFILAIVATLVIWFIYRFTTIGYEMIVTGLNSKAAEAGGIKPDFVRGLSMVISGGLAGIGGGLLVATAFGRFIMNISPGYGYDGIAISILGQTTPFGVFLSSILFGGLRTGSLSMDMFVGIPSEVITILQGIMILTISAPSLFAFIYKKGGTKGEQ